jgi:hypothetical protein
MDDMERMAPAEEETQKLTGYQTIDPNSEAESRPKFMDAPDAEYPWIKPLAFGFNFLLFFAAVSIVYYRTYDEVGRNAGYVLKSRFDRKQYLPVTLGNDLPVLIISDPKADKAAAALSVGSGKHLEEHLFM